MKFMRSDSVFSKTDISQELLALSYLTGLGFCDFKKLRLSKFSQGQFTLMENFSWKSK